jgi:hypothetical protein
LRSAELFPVDEARDWGELPDGPSSVSPLATVHKIAALPPAEREPAIARVAPYWRAFIRKFLEVGFRG